MHGRYFLMRMGDACLTLVAISIVVFLAVRVLPADPALLLAGEYARPGELEAIRAELGLDHPVYVQYVRWAVGALTGDLGRSIRTQPAVSTVFRERAPATLQLALAALAIGGVVGLPLGVVGATHRNSWVDRPRRLPRPRDQPRGACGELGRGSIAGSLRSKASYAAVSSPAPSGAGSP